MRQDQDLLRVTLQLVDLEKGSNIWADSYDLAAAETESLAAQRQIAAEVVATLGDPNGVMARAALAQLQDVDPESLGPDDCVLQLYAYRGEASPQAHAALRHCLAAAVEQAPMHAEAWAGLAWIALDEHRYGFNPLEPEELSREEAAEPVLERALTQAQKAVALDPGNARVHLALAAAHFYRGEVREFEAAASAARELNPNDSDLLAELATYYALSGRWTLGRRLLKDAKARNPAHTAWYDFVAVLDLYRQGDYEAAAASARKLHAPDWYWTHVLRAMACARIGDIEGVRASRDRLLALYPEFPERAREEFRRLGVSSTALIEEFLVGLRQAGLLSAARAGLRKP